MLAINCENCQCELDASSHQDTENDCSQFPHPMGGEPVCMECYMLLDRYAGHLDVFERIASDLNREGEYCVSVEDRFPLIVVSVEDHDLNTVSISDAESLFDGRCTVTITRTLRAFSRACKASLTGSDVDSIVKNVLYCLHGEQAFDIDSQGQSVVTGAYQYVANNIHNIINTSAGE